MSETSFPHGIENKTITQIYKFTQKSTKYALLNLMVNPQHKRNNKHV